MSVTADRQRLFVESAGPNAATRLAALVADARAAGAHAELLRSQQDPQLWLAAIRGDYRPDARKLEGAGVWRFALVEPDT